MGLMQYTSLSTSLRRWSRADFLVRSHEKSSCRYGASGKLISANGQGGIDSVGTEVTRDFWHRWDVHEDPWARAETGGTRE